MDPAFNDIFTYKVVPILKNIKQKIFYSLLDQFFHCRCSYSLSTDEYCLKCKELEKRIPTLSYQSLDDVMNHRFIYNFK
jgi:hypothetical protein